MTENIKRQKYVLKYREKINAQSYKMNVKMLNK